MLTEKQKLASELISRAGSAKSLEARARNISKVIQAFSLGDKELVEQAAGLMRQAGNEDDRFEILSALCQERMGMYYGAGRIYMKHGLMDEVRRLIEASSGGLFNIEKFHAAKLCMLLGDFGRAAALARVVEGMSIDFVALERSREKEYACVQNNLHLAGKIYAELEAIAPELGMWKGEAARIAHTLLSDAAFNDAVSLFHVLGMQNEAREAAGRIGYDPECCYDMELIQTLLAIGMDHKALEIAEGIQAKPSRANRSTKAAEIFSMLGLDERAASIYLSCGMSLNAISALKMEE